MKVNNWEVPEGYESMTCFRNCGFIVIWAHGEGNRAMEDIQKHLLECPNEPFRKRKREKE